MEKWIAVGIVLFSMVTLARGPSVSGGVPPAPRGVVIQGYLVDGSFDQDARETALALAGEHFAQDRVFAVTQRPENQFEERSYLCIEYKNYQDSVAASDEFKAALADFESLEVVSNSHCR